MKSTVEHFRLLLLYLLLFVSSCLGDYGQSLPPWEDAFLVNQFTCSGTLIHPNWILTAAHCMDDQFFFAKKKDTLDSGDVIFHFAEEDFILPVQVTGIKGPLVEHFWRVPLNPYPGTNSSLNSNEKWRVASRIICHPGFEGEALSWKGNDFCLVELYPKQFTKPQGAILPACLPSKSSYDINHKETYYTTGYGRRQVNFCLTDLRGPEKFAICESSPFCRTRRRGSECGLTFLYEGKKRFKCQHEIPNPSLKNPVCKELFNGLKSNQNIPHHVFSSNGIYNTTCYPKINGLGWCATRDYGDTSTAEPSHQSGWGYCSEDSASSHCNGLSPAQRKYNPQAFSIRLLSGSVCESKLGDNLRVEQPEVMPEEFQDLLNRYSVFCTGRIFPGNHAQDAFFQSTLYGGYREIEGSSEKLRQLYGIKGFAKEYLNGGPNCFGDSGGPLWKYSEIAESGKIGPVLVGVFSFMLWGTCLGRQEPPFFGRVKDKLDWIYKFVPENEVCHGR